MRFLKGIISTLLFINSTVALSPAALSLQRRVPQRFDDEDDYRGGDGRDDDRFRTSTVYGGGSARTTTIRQQPPGGRTTTITGRPVTSTVTRRTTVTIAGPSPAPNNGGGRRGPNSQCPQQWFQISNELNTMFGAGAGCTKDAHTAIRAIFHDCFPVGGCDGSLAMQEELSRPANQIMASSINKFKSLAQKYRVSMADMFAFAGSHAVISCPGGPVVKTYIGRRDANRAAPDGQLPPHFALARDSLEAFRVRGFTAQELAALLGAHTVSRQFNTNPQRVGASQDTTPDVWDSNYYVQTLLGTAPLSFDSDINLGRQEDVGPWMSQFASDKATWDRVFSQAMTKLSLLGTAGSSAMVDCTAALPVVRAPPPAIRMTVDEEEAIRNLNLTMQRVDTLQ